MRNRLIVVLGLLALWSAALDGCSHTVRVLHAAPQAAYEIMGMVSGQGPNHASAMDHMMSQASSLGAQAVILHGSRAVGHSTIVRGQAIRWRGEPPPEHR
jgi:hypothetical protein